MSNIANLRDAMPAHIRKQWEEQDRLQARLTEELRKHCADALNDLADAVRSPRISRATLESALLHVTGALAVAAILDPKEAA